MLLLGRNNVCSRDNSCITDYRKTNWGENNDIYFAHKLTHWGGSAGSLFLADSASSGAAQKLGDGSIQIIGSLTCLSPGLGRRLEVEGWNNRGSLGISIAQCNLSPWSPSMRGLRQAGCIHIEPSGCLSQGQEPAGIYITFRGLALKVMRCHPDHILSVGTINKPSQVQGEAT